MAGFVLVRCHPPSESVCFFFLFKHFLHQILPIYILTNNPEMSDTTYVQLETDVASNIVKK